jgi:hypothetical protein
MKNKTPDTDTKIKRDLKYHVDIRRSHIEKAQSGILRRFDHIDHEAPPPGLHRPITAQIRNHTSTGRIERTFLILLTLSKNDK